MGVYPLLRLALQLAGNIVTFAVVAVVLLFWHGLHGQPLDALPAAFMWYLILGACRWLGRRLPVPVQASVVPMAAAIPPAAVAVSIVPTATGMACPDFDTMRRQLPSTVARLLR